VLLYQAYQLVFQQGYLTTQLLELVLLAFLESLALLAS